MDATSSDWNTAENWTPPTVPNGPEDVATFGTSNITEVTVSASVELNHIVFASGASPFSINPNGHSITISGAGVTNDSGVTQNFVINSAPGGFVYFTGIAIAGESVQYTLNGGTSLGTFGYTFFDTSTAATSTFIINGGADATNKQSGQLTFNDNSSADNATIVLNGGDNGAFGGACLFNGTSSASAAHIFVNGATKKGGGGGILRFEFLAASAGQAVITVGGSDIAGAGQVYFDDSSTAENATLIAQGGQVAGGTIIFDFIGNPSGGMSKVQLFGNGRLINLLELVQIGSIEGDGIVSLQENTLEIGTNGLDTTFAGTINDRGSFTKTGPWTLTLTGANTYAGGTTIEDGILVIYNQSGSGTGDGAGSGQCRAMRRTGYDRRNGDRRHRYWRGRHPDPEKTWRQAGHAHHPERADLQLRR